MKIAVAGAGYVGLAMATLLARIHNVMLVDVVAEKVRMVNKRVCPISDPEIEAIFAEDKKGIAAIELCATCEEEKAYADAEIVIIATPTNYDADAGSFDTASVEYVIKAVRQVNPNAWIVIKSTVPVGFTEKMRHNTQDDRILFSPEFLREGKALYDNLHPSRIVVGTDLSNEEASEFARQFAHLLAIASDEDSVQEMIYGSTEAEAIKLFANSYLALRVSYFNELDTYAQIRGLDAAQIIQGVCADPRIGNHYNNPSFGYGGYCLPKDTKQLLANYSDVPQDIISAIVSANETRKTFIADEVERAIKDRSHATVGIYRLTMKEGSDNCRQSSIQGIMQTLKRRGYDILVYEPTCMESTFLGCRITDDLHKFKQLCTLILANRLSDELEDVASKVYTRDIYRRD